LPRHGSNSLEPIRFQRGATNFNPAGTGLAMKFLVHLVLVFLAGLAIGYVLLNLWDVMGGPDPFGVRYGRW
jgi:hypothetical protein